jgi:heme-degrading monooxygenase HmoA
MIIEVADIRIRPGTVQDFEAALVNAVNVFRQAKGCMGLHAQRCIEDAHRYHVVIRWETLEDHTVGFRGHLLFQEWRALVGPFLAEPPEVLHFEMVLDRVAFSEGLT